MPVAYWILKIQKLQSLLFKLCDEFDKMVRGGSCHSSSFWCYDRKYSTFKYFYSNLITIQIQKIRL